MRRHIEAALESVTWADESSSSILRARTTPCRSPGATRAHRRPGVARLRRAAELRGRDRLARLDPLPRCRRTCQPELAVEVRRYALRGRRRRLPHSARNLVSRPLDSRHRPVSRLPASPLRSALGRWNSKPGSRIGSGRCRPPRRSATSCNITPIATSRTITNIDRYTTLAAEQWLAEGRRTNRLGMFFHPPAHSFETTSCAAASATAPGILLSRLNSYYVFLKLPKLWEFQRGLPHAWFRRSARREQRPPPPEVRADSERRGPQPRGGSRSSPLGRARRRTRAAALRSPSPAAGSPPPAVEVLTPQGLLAQICRIFWVVAACHRGAALRHLCHEPLGRDMQAIS